MMPEPSAVTAAVPSTLAIVNAFLTLAVMYPHTFRFLLLTGTPAPARQPLASRRSAA
jgi:hypothetical protein